jgi:hypothetical protein
MSNYVFLDTWVLSEYTKPSKQHLLSDFIRSNNYTVLIDSLSVTELYNPGWREAISEERVSRVTRFLGQHPYAIVDPQDVFKSEIEAFPTRLSSIPIRISSEHLPSHLAAPALVALLRRDPVFLEQGIDIAQWAQHYQTLKAGWLQDIDQITDHACAHATLARNSAGTFINLTAQKEGVLQTLDRRHFSHFSPEEREALGVKIVELVMGATSQLPAVRLSSLYFWYAYVDTDKAYPMKRQGSDIGDFYQMSLIPYCAAFTVDSTMYRLVQRVLADVSYPCTTLNPKQLELALNQ